jgi:hypothetical protein
MTAESANYLLKCLRISKVQFGPDDPRTQRYAKALARLDASAEWWRKHGGLTARNAIRRPGGPGMNR